MIQSFLGTSYQSSHHIYNNNYNNHIILSVILILIDGGNCVRIVSKMETITCSHTGCTCDYSREELMARADLSPGGLCVECNHKIKDHSRRNPTGNKFS